MRLFNWFGKKRSEAYENVRRRMVSTFEKDIEACNLLVKITKKDEFLLALSISNTFERLKQDRGTINISHADYDKLLLEVANEIKRKYLNK